MCVSILRGDIRIKVDVTVWEAYKKGYKVSMYDNIPRMTYTVQINLLNGRINMIDLPWEQATLLTIKGMRSTTGVLRPGNYWYHAIIWHIRDYKVI